MATESAKPFWKSKTLWGVALTVTGLSLASHLHPTLALVLTWGGLAVVVWGRIAAGKVTL